MEIVTNSAFNIFFLGQNIFHQIQSNSKSASSYLQLRLCLFLRRIKISKDYNGPIRVYSGHYIIIGKRMRGGVDNIGTVQTFQLYCHPIHHWHYTWLISLLSRLLTDFLPLPASCLSKYLSVSVWSTRNAENELVSQKQSLDLLQGTHVFRMKWLQIGSILQFLFMSFKNS